jgi:hypothetical protein
VALAVVGGVVLARAGADRSETGVVVDVESSGLTDVRAFTLRGSDGRQRTFRIGSLENAAEFPPGHLVEHIASAEPVRVFYREEEGGLIAYRLEDAER